MSALQVATRGQAIAQKANLTKVSKKLSIELSLP